MNLTFSLCRARTGTLALISLTALSFSLPLHAAKHERNWQVGTLLDAQNSQINLGTYGHTTTSGTVDNNGIYRASSHTKQEAEYAREEVAVVDGGDKIYVIERQLKWWNKEANLTVNAPVHFAIDGQHMYLRDDDGREFKTKIIKKTLKN